MISKSPGEMAVVRYSTMASSSPSPLTKPRAQASSLKMSTCLERLTCN
uniref:Uncharacterized protein n=1 Tax=Rhizophora mucronata TaxID=61149 RepID=A0A2P2NV93_RHIMU